MFEVEWKILGPEDVFIGPPCPNSCEAGPTSHIWDFHWDVWDGFTLSTTECVICNRSINNGLSDWPHEYLTIDLKVTLESVTEKSGSWETTEYDHYVQMYPVQTAKKVQYG